MGEDTQQVYHLRKDNDWVKMAMIIWVGDNGIQEGIK